MNSFRVNNCVKCDDCTVNNKGKDWDEQGFYIECDLGAWEKTRRVKISSQSAPIPDNCPKIVGKSDEDDD